MQVLAWISVLGCFLLIGSSYAWYSLVIREADSETVEVMEPYYLTLLNSGGKDALQLSVGSLMPGRTKQIVFCVSNKKNEEKINMGGSDFDYSMELIHTNNLALDYKIYELEKSDEINGKIVTNDSITEEDGSVTTKHSYWNVKVDGVALAGTDVSDKRYEQVGISGSEINSGTYIEYTKDTGTNGEDGTNLHLTSSAEDGYESEYFLMEIEWKDSAQSNFEKYERETDMIYILVKALQPKPSQKGDNH